MATYVNGELLSSEYCDLDHKMFISSFQRPRELAVVSVLAVGSNVNATSAFGAVGDNKEASRQPR